MSLAVLSIDLEARLVKFEQSMDKAARIAEKNADASRAAWARVGKQFAEVGGAIAGAFAGFSVVEFLRGNIDAIDSLNDMQDATGSTIEKLSGLVDIAQRTGHSLDDATSLVVKLNAALNDRDADSTASRAIAAIGLSATELRRLDPVDAIQEVARALGRYADDGSKARLVQELFGKSARELAPLLKDLADAGELVAKVTTEQAEEADKFNKRLAEMQTNISNAAKAFTAELLPALNAYLARVADGSKTLDSLGFNDKYFANRALAPYAKQVNDLKFEKRVLEEQLRADYTNADTERRRARLKQINEVELPAARSRFKAADETFNPPSNGAPANDNYSNEGRNSPKPSVGDLPDKDKKPKAVKAEKDEMAASPPIPEMRKSALEAIKNSDIVKAQELRDTLYDLLRLRESSGADTESIDQAIANVNTELEKFDPAARKAADEQKRLKDLLAETDSEKLEKARQDMERLEKAFLDGKITVQQFNEAAKARLNLGAKDEISELDEFAKQAGRNIQTTLGQSMYATLSGDWGKLGQLWADTLLRMAAEASAAQLGSLLFGDFGKTGSVGGWAGTALSWISGFFADGAAFNGAGQVHAFADGDVFGTATPFRFGGGKLGVMGEAGPEAVMPLKRGPDGKLGVVSRGGSGGQALQVTYAPVIQVDSRVDRAATIRDTQEIVQQGHRDLLKLLKAKGALP